MATQPLQRRPSLRPFYVLLFLYAAVSLTYHIASSSALIDTYFDLSHHARRPFQIDWDHSSITEVAEEAKQAGLEKGDVIESVDEQPFTGEAQVLADERDAHPHDTLRVRVRKPDGSYADSSIELRSYGSSNSAVAEGLPLVIIQIAIPLVCLLIGYWVVAARPNDPNAWLILVLLSFPEAFFAVSPGNAWSGPWLLLRNVWGWTLQVLTPAALLWFGLLFPERSRVDRRLPWLKWMILSVQVIILGVLLAINYARYFSPKSESWRTWVDPLNNSVLGYTSVLGVLLFAVVLADKLRSRPTPDARRRLRVLAFGSLIGLGSIVITFGLLPRFGLSARTDHWLELAVSILYLVFPFSLAYVVFVQRAMDVSILLRAGTKYALAKYSLLAVQLSILAFLIFRFIVPVIERNDHQTLNVILVTVLAALVLRFYVLRRRLSAGARLQQWLDRKFFREAYDAEHVLSELSAQVRTFRERGPMLETVVGRIADVLHVREIAVLLRSQEGFTLQSALGLNADGPLALSESAAAAQTLIKVNKPAIIYRENPPEWFAGASVAERQTLDFLQTELLLPLQGREELMGIMSLGSKKSEEPYSPSDLRLLQSIAAQTGLALEITDLAHSLAQEAAQRERLNREIEIAREVQQRLFPQRIPALEGVTLAGGCRPALGIGGDYYDFIPLADGRLGIAIGDVSGKGIPAALLMAGLRASLHGMAMDGLTDLALMMKKINRLVFEASDVHRYATFFFATYRPASRELRYVNAGHNTPFVVRSTPTGTNEAIPLDVGGPVVGLIRTVPYTEGTIMLQSGDLVIAYTDGISEAMTSAEEEWGEDRMLIAADAVFRQPAETILAAVFHDCDAFTAGAPQHDDMTLLIMKLAESGQAGGQQSTNS